MAFTATYVGKYLTPGGMMTEYGTYVATAATTTGTITANTTEQPEIVEILEYGASDDADKSIVCATDGGDNTLKLTFTALASGKYFIKGKAK